MDLAEDNLTIVLSPAQLAAVLIGETISAHQKLIFRTLGTVQLISSALQLGAGIAMTADPIPEPASHIAGVGLALHGADSGWAAVKQIRSGNATADYTQIFTTKLARSFGASDNAAGWIGVAADIGVPVGLGITGLAKASRVAVKSGRITLLDHESTTTQKLGHTIRDHMAQTEAQMRDRLLKTKSPEAISTFASQDIAEKVISNGLSSNRVSLIAWAMHGGDQLVLEVSSKTKVGAGVVRATGKLTEMTWVKIVIRRSKTAGRIYYILTAYPMLPPT